MYPESHGIIGNDLYDPVYKKILDLQSKEFSNDPKVWKQAEQTEPVWLTAKNEVSKSRII